MSMCADGSVAALANNSFANALQAGLKLFHQSYSPVHLFVSTALCALGVVANSIHLKVLTSRRLRHQSVNVLLAAIALCDMGTMALYLVYKLHFNILIDDADPCRFFDMFSKFWTYFRVVQSWMCIWLHSSSLWLSVAMAMFRFMTMRSVSPRMFWTSSHRAVYVTIVIFATVFLSALPTPFLYGIYTEHLDVNLTRQCNRPLDEVIHLASMSQWAIENSCLIMKANLWVSAIFFKFSPCVLLTVLSTLLIGLLVQLNRKRMRSAIAQSQAVIQMAATAKLTKAPGIVNRRNRGHASSTTTVILVLIVLSTVVTELPQGILTFAGAFYTGYVYIKIYPYLTDLTDLLSLLNSCANFVLCVSVSSNYRQVAWTVLVKPVLKVFGIKCRNRRRRFAEERDCTVNATGQVRASNRLLSYNFDDKTDAGLSLQIRQSKSDNIAKAEQQYDLLNQTENESQRRQPSVRRSLRRQLSLFEGAPDKDDSNSTSSGSSERKISVKLKLFERLSDQPLSNRYDGGSPYRTQNQGLRRLSLKHVAGRLIAGLITTTETDRPSCASAIPRSDSCGSQSTGRSSHMLNGNNHWTRCAKSMRSNPDNRANRPFAYRNDRNANSELRRKPYASVHYFQYGHSPVTQKALNVLPSINIDNSTEHCSELDVLL